MTQKTLLIVVVTALVTATLVLFLTRNQEQQGLSEEERIAVTPDSPSETVVPLAPYTAHVEEKELPRITKAMVDALLLGVTIEEVEDQWERISDDMESEHHPGLQGYTSPYVVLWHSWNNSDGTRVKLGFINKKLDRKQFYYRDGNFSTSEVDLEALAEEKPGVRTEPAW